MPLSWKAPRMSIVPLPWFVFPPGTRLSIYNLTHNYTHTNPRCSFGAPQMRCGAVGNPEATRVSPIHLRVCTAASKYQISIGQTKRMLNTHTHTDSLPRNVKLSGRAALVFNLLRGFRGRIESDYRVGRNPFCQKP